MELRGRKFKAAGLAFQSCRHGPIAFGKDFGNSARKNM
jgi:hypothetical protein